MFVLVVAYELMPGIGEERGEGRVQRDWTITVPGCIILIEPFASET
jgi:hypothetical protein